MSTEKKRILVIDDEPGLTRLLKLNLEQTGDYEVCTENDATIALDTAVRFHPNLILLDVMMPELDGGELASRFQAHPGLRDIPLVFLTAAVRREEIRSHRGLIGGLPFLAKPVELEEVIKCLHHHLGPPAPAPAHQVPAH